MFKVSDFKLPMAFLKKACRYADCCFVDLPVVFAYCNDLYNESMTDWDIYDNVTCKNEVIYVDGDIEIFSGASLNLSNITLNINGTYDGDIQIYGRSGSLGI